MAVRSPRHFRRGGAALAVAAMALLAACSNTTQPQSAAISSAKQAIDDAIHDGAQQRAPEDLAMAQQKLAQAQKSASDGYYDDARRYAEESGIDARLAGAKSRTVAANNALNQLQGNAPPQR
jgi:predicted small secreted protein